MLWASDTQRCREDLPFVERHKSFDTLINHGGVTWKNEPEPTPMKVFYPTLRLDITTDIITLKSYLDHPYQLLFTGDETIANFCFSNKFLVYLFWRFKRVVKLYFKLFLLYTVIIFFWFFDSFIVGQHVADAFVINVFCSYVCLFRCFIYL